MIRHDEAESLSGLRILVTADAVGGVWTYAADLAQGLTARGVSVVMAVLGPALEADQRAASAGLDVVETHLPLDWLARSPRDILRAGAAVAALAHECSADIVHLNSPALAADANFPAPVVGTCHSCVRTWFTAVRASPLPPDFVWRADLTGRGYAASDILTAPSGSFARATADAYGLDREPVIVRNGCRPHPCGPARPTCDVVFTAGRLWDDGKGIATLDEAASRLTIPVLAAGALEGPNGARIALRHARSLGRLDSPAVAAQLAERPIFVSPALYEPFGLAVLEAADAGCALVLSDIATFRELWDGAAIFVPPGDAPALAAAIASLASDPARRAERGKAARTRAASYTADAMVDGMADVYRRALRQPRRSACHAKTRNLAS